MMILSILKFCRFSILEILTDIESCVCFVEAERTSVHQHV
jgi:hypothetical protein